MPLPFFVDDRPTFTPRGKVHGNWCGFGHTAQGPPIDALDEACRKHDLGYDLDGFQNRAVDERFVRDITAWLQEAEKRDLPFRVLAAARLMRQGIQVSLASTFGRNAGEATEIADFESEVHGEAEPGERPSADDFRDQIDTALDSLDALEELREPDEVVELRHTFAQPTRR